MVAVIAASGGNSGIALGDATGSSVVNLAVVLGLAVVAVPIAVRRSELRRDLPAVLAATALVGVLAADGTVSRLDAALLLILFVGWLAWAANDARRGRDATAEVVGDETVRLLPRRPRARSGAPRGGRPPGRDRRQVDR